MEQQLRKEIEDSAGDKMIDKSEVKEAHGNDLPEGVCCTVQIGWNWKRNSVRSRTN